ncbi:MAG: cell division protein FtsL [Myxococcales bacterium]|nr:cell division protein FtsL [Myxococcales bacterium]
MSAVSSGLPRRSRSSFVLVWTLVVTATVCAFIVHLALRGKTVSLGYELGRSRAEQARLREVKRVLEVEAASYKTPERVEIVARSLLGMEAPPADRIVQMPGAPEPRRVPLAATEGAEQRGAAP